MEYDDLVKRMAVSSGSDEAPEIIYLNCSQPSRNSVSVRSQHSVCLIAEAKASSYEARILSDASRPSLSLHPVQRAADSCTIGIIGA